MSQSVYVHAEQSTTEDLMLSAMSQSVHNSSNPIAQHFHVLDNFQKDSPVCVVYNQGTQFFMFLDFFSVSIRRKQSTFRKIVNFPKKSIHRKQSISRNMLRIVEILSKTGQKERKHYILLTSTHQHFYFVHESCLEPLELPQPDELTDLAIRRFGKIADKPMHW